MLQLEKEVRLGYGKRTGRGYVSVVREHYLRDDVGCKREGCSLCVDSPSDGRHLPPSASHYLMPDVAALRDYLELFEHPSITDIILLQTAISHVIITPLIYGSI